MSNSKIRRQFENYRLPSESKQLLQSLCGQQIVDAKVGLRGLQAKAVVDGVHHQDSLSVERNGDGGFLELEDGRTIAFRFDEFPSSLVLRELDAALGDKRFFDHLYAEDTYVPSFLKIHLLVDMPGSRALVGKKIAAASIYKHPDNYRGNRHRCDQLHEVAIGLKMSDGSEYLLTPGFGKTRPADVVSVQPVSVLEGKDGEAPESVWATQSTDTVN